MLKKSFFKSEITSQGYMNGKSIFCNLRNKKILKYIQKLEFFSLQEKNFKNYCSGSSRNIKKTRQKTSTQTRVIKI